MRHLEFVMRNPKRRRQSPRANLRTIVIGGLRSVNDLSGACGSGVAQAALVAFSAGESDAVEVFADGDGVLAGGAQQVAELGHRDGGAIGEAVADLAAEVGVDIGVEVEAGVDLGDLLLVAEQREQVGDDAGAGAGGGGELGRVGRGDAARPDRVGEFQP